MNVGSPIDKLFGIWHEIEKRYLPEEVWGKDPLTLWKERAIFSIYLVMFVFGSIALIPSLVLAFRLKLWLIFATDIIFYLIAIFVWFSKTLPLKIRTWLSMLLFYSLGAVLLFSIGFYGAGYLWLLVASLISGMILDKREAVIMMLLNFFCMLAFGGYILYGAADWISTVRNPGSVWLVITANFMLVNILAVLFISGIKSNMEDALERQIAAQSRSMDEALFFQNIIDSMPGLFFFFRVEDSENRLEQWNKNLEATLGYSPQELSGRTLFQFVETKNRRLVEAKTEELLENGRVRFDIEFLKKDHTLVPLHIEAFGFKKEGEFYIIGSAIDISQRIAEEKEKSRMQRRLAIAQKTGALGTLASGIAHDFNNILSGIQGYAELIKAAPDDLKTVEKGVDQILGGSRRAGELVQQILTFNRQVENEKRPMKLYLLVKEAVKFLRSSIPPTIEIKEAISSRDSIYADTTQIYQVLINLCTNAYHAMRKNGGVLSVFLEETTLSAEPEPGKGPARPGRYLVLTVADTGHGMDKETLSRIFEPYFTTKKSGEGTGLGLAVVSGIIEDHLGVITVDSEPDHGTTVCIHLPVWEDDILEPAPGETAPEAAKPVPGGNCGKIMVVDDEVSIRMSVKSMLEDYGYEVEVFPDGGQALERFMAAPEHFSLVITDIAMPGMPGDRLCVEMLEARKDLPIIMFTGYSDFSSEMAADVGIKNYLQKPVDGKKLLVLVQEVLEPEQTV